MSGKKISELPTGTQVSGPELFPAVQSATTKKFTLSSVLAWIKSQISASSIGAQPTITASGILKGDGAGGVSAATADTDYQAPLTAGTDYATPAQLADKANPGQIGYPESGTTASRNYSAGEYICWNGLIYTADTNIALGATLSASGGNKNLTAVPGGGLNGILDSLGKLVTNGSAEMDNYTVFQVILTDPWVQGAARISCVYVKGTEVFMPYITYTGAQTQLYYAAYRINYNSQTRSIQIISALASNGSTATPSISQIFGLV